MPEKKIREISLTSKLNFLREKQKTVFALETID